MRNSHNKRFNLLRTDPNLLSAITGVQIMGDITSCCDAKSYPADIGEQINRSVIKHPQIPPNIKLVMQKAMETKYFRKSLLSKSSQSHKQHQSYKQKRHDTNKDCNGTSNHHSETSISKRILSLSQEKQTIRIGKVIYQGQLNNKNEVDGYGLLYLEHGFFEGSFKNGRPVNGVMVFSEDAYFVGDISQNIQASGQGLYEDLKTRYRYEGKWSRSMPHDHGHESLSNGDQFQGNFLQGSKSGEGVYKFYQTNAIYKGNFYNNFPHGYGKLTLSNQNSYEGQWKLGQMHGKGKFKWPSNKQHYEGEYKNGSRHGFGVYKFSNGSIYEGNWKDGKQDGDGKIKQGYDEVKGYWEKGTRISMIF